MNSIQQVVNCTQVIDEILLPYRAVISQDYLKYRNHVCRVYLNCLLLDNNTLNEGKYAVAAVFHDIGIWTNNTIDYLDPSVKQAMFFLDASSKEDWKSEVELMISWHHKVTTYKGEYCETVENFRKADWIDVSLGWVRFGADKKHLKMYQKLLPNAGFHLFLLRKIVANFLHHPLNPLPMFKK